MKTEPYEHQRLAFEKIKDKNYYAIFMDTGLGKTWLAIAYCELILANSEFALVICPKTLIKNWANEITKHSNKLQAITELKKPDNNKPAVVILNYEFFRNPDKVDKLLQTFSEFKIVIADEASMIKNPKAQQSEGAIFMSQLAKYRLILTATPTTQAIDDIFNLFKFLDHGKTFGTNYYKFKRKYFENIQDKNPRLKFPIWVPKKGAIKEILEKIEPYTIKYTKSEVLNLPPKIYSQSYIELSQQQIEVYNKLAQEDILAMKGNEEIIISTQIAKLAKYKQITSGFYYMPDENKVVEFKENPKLEELKFLVNKFILENKKILIWTTLKYERKLIYNELVKYFKQPILILDSDLDDKQRFDIVDKFNKSKPPVILLAALKIAKYGLNIFADNVIFYSNDFSFESRYQAEDRAYRIGTKGSVLYYDLIADGFIDSNIQKIINNKLDIHKHVMGFKSLIYVQPEDMTKQPSYENT
ncbi:MAG: DEAD/DEAH box helicase [Thermoplasmata archaeon]